MGLEANLETMRVRDGTTQAGNPGETIILIDILCLFLIVTSYHEQIKKQKYGHDNHVGLGWTLTHEKKDLQPRRNILQLCLLQKMASIEQR